MCVQTNDTFLTRIENTEKKYTIDAQYTQSECTQLFVLVHRLLLNFRYLERSHGISHFPCIALWHLTFDIWHLTFDSVWRDPKSEQFWGQWVVGDIIFHIYVVRWVGIGSGPVMIYKAITVFQIFLVHGQCERTEVFQEVFSSHVHVTQTDCLNSLFDV